MARRNLTTLIDRRRSRRGFTLIELMVVILILGLLASLLIAKFRGVSEQASDAALDMQLHRTRKQIEYFRAQLLDDPTLLANQWQDLVENDYLQQSPINVLNGSTLVAAAPGNEVGWIWRDDGTGTGRFALYATDATGLIERPD